MRFNYTTNMLSPRILFEDNHLIVLDKPAGLLSQGEVTGDENLVDWLRGHFGRHYVGLIHRLDRNTSGIMVVAKRTKAAQRLSDALRDGKLTRTYLGWAEGTLAAPARWRHFLHKDERTNLVRVVPAKAPGVTPGAKEAVMRATPVRSGSWKGVVATLVEFELKTGRSHQIRAQSAHEGHPLLGDVKYGARTRDFGRPALHSFRLSFPHPMSKEQLTFEAELPEDLRI